MPMIMTTKPFKIDKNQVVMAYKAIKANKGSAGVDRQTFEQFDKNLKGNLYKIWNRMSSGTYFPSAIRGVSIPKKTGGERTLGIPTISDRIAQMVVKQQVEPDFEAVFLPDSYGYRPHKSALEAVGVTRKRCWKRDWVVEFDIKGLFDSLPHDLLLKAVRKHVSCKWVLLYIERWLIAPLEKQGVREERKCGIPQGGVISPCLSNLFLHYAFDIWMKRKYPHLLWCRYADDGLIHCETEEEAKAVMAQLQIRLAECGLQMHPTKSKIIYCKDSNRKGEYPEVSFDFLGYQFRPRRAGNPKTQKVFCSFLPAVSPSAIKGMRGKVRELNIQRHTSLSLTDIAEMLNPLLRGWIEYYGRYSRTSIRPILRTVNLKMRGWLMRKFKRYRGHKTRAGIFLGQLSQTAGHLFAHWNIGLYGAFA
jgi:RNA-directed DNA polymerase